MENVIFLEAENICGTAKGLVLSLGELLPLM